MRIRFRHLVCAGVVCTASALAADAATYGRATRNLRCVGATAATVFHFKVLFDEENPSVTHQRVASLWRHVCASNAGMYIKLAQGIASMNHVLPVEYQKELGMLQDKAPFVEFAQVDRVMREELGPDWRAGFASFEETPVASASIAQVHKAQLLDGTPVAVKVQKPAIAKQLDWDMWCYRLIVWTFDRVFGVPVYWTVDTTVATILKEADFVNEAHNGERAGHHLRECGLGPTAAVPFVHWPYTTRRVLTAEWIDGVKISDGPGMQALGLNVGNAVQTMVEVFSSQIFVSGFIHCDPHPGNVLVRRRLDDKGRIMRGKHQVVVLDHGMYMELSESFRHDYARMWKAMVLMDTPTLTSIASNWGIGDPAFFASLQMFKPYKPERGATHLETTTVSDIHEMHLSAKDKLRQLLFDTAVTPRELVFVGRNMNLVRASNKHHGSPVNRINTMAKYAAIGAGIPPRDRWRDEAGGAWIRDEGGRSSSDSGGVIVGGSSVDSSGGAGGVGKEDSLTVWWWKRWDLFVFHARLWVISTYYYAAMAMRVVNRWLGREDVGGFEDQLEKSAGARIEERFGIKINIQDDGKGFG